MGVDRRVCAVRRPVAVRRRAPRAVACARVAAALQFGVRISATVGAGCARGSRPPGAPPRWGGLAALGTCAALQGWSRGAGRPCAACRRSQRRAAPSGARAARGLSKIKFQNVLAWPWAAAGRAAGAAAGASGDREARRERNRPANPGNGEPNPGDAEGAGFTFRLREARSSPCASGS